MQDVLSSIRKSVDQADNAVKAVQADLVSQLNTHAEGLAGGASGAPVKGVFSRPVPAWYLGVAGVTGVALAVFGRIFV